MAVHYRTQGFILKKIDRGEADQFFTVYTKDFGKLDILGKAIRKIKSKLRAGIELFYLSEIEFIHGKTHKTLTDAILIEKFQELRDNLDKLEIAGQIVGILDGLVEQEQKDGKIWDLLNEVFDKLKIIPISSGISGEIGKKLLKIENQPPEEFVLIPEKLKIIYYYFIWNLLSILGYQTDLYYCVICQKKLLPQKLYFNITEGGIVCSVHNETKKGLNISPDIIKILRLFIKKDWNILLKLKIKKADIKKLDLISETYFSHYKFNKRIKI